MSNEAFRDNKGRFLAGIKKPIGGRPANSGQQAVKDLCWESINKIAKLIFAMPEREMKAYLEIFADEMTLAERMYLQSAQMNLGVIESLLDRIIGKQLKIDSGNTEKNPIIERLYSLSAGGVKRDIDQLIRNRQLIHAEYGATEASSAQRTDKPEQI